jgi:hypothetical protein
LDNNKPDYKTKDRHSVNSAKHPRTLKNRNTKPTGKINVSKPKLRGCILREQHPNITKGVQITKNPNPVNTYRQNRNSPTFPPLLTATPLQTQVMQMYSPFNHCVPPIHQQMDLSDINYSDNADRGQHIQKMTSSSEDEETQPNINNKCQTVRSTKRKKLLISQK